MLRILFGLLILVFIFTSSSNIANATSLNLNSVIPWACPPTIASTPPTAETGRGISGDRLYLHVIDSKGNDLEIWCKTSFFLGLRYWEVEVSFPNGDKSVLSKCEFSPANNKFLLKFSGTESRVPSLSGSIIIHIDGELEFFKHDNDDFWSDIHTTYNFTSGEAIRIDTKKSHTPTSVTEKVVDTTKKTINLLSPPSSIFAWNTDSIKLPDGETFVCTSSEQDETSFIRPEISQMVVGNSAKTFLLYYPQMNGINEITINEETKSLQVFFSEKFVENRYLSISIPRDLIDHSEDESFTISDGTKNQIVFEESTTDNYRTLNFDLSSSSSIVEIFGTQLFKQLPPQSESVFDLISPNKQHSAGVSPEKILCNEGFELILKADLESSACVKPQTISKLEERGWSSMRTQLKN